MMDEIRALSTREITEDATFFFGGQSVNQIEFPC
jgi:hypothetical protein